MLHPLEFAALLAAARSSGPNDHALVCLLGMLGLRVSEAGVSVRLCKGFDLDAEALRRLGEDKA